MEGALGAAPSRARAWLGAREPGGLGGRQHRGSRPEETGGWGAWCSCWCGQPAERAERSGLGAPGASVSWRGRGDALVGLGRAAVQEEFRVGSQWGARTSRPGGRNPRHNRETRAPGKTENLEAEP